MQTPEQAKAHIASIARLVEWLTDTRIEELHRRAQHAARDGYPTSTMGAGSSGGDVSDPTGEYVVAADPRDLVLGWITEAFAELHEAAGHCVKALGKGQEAMRIEVEEKGRKAAGEECQACGEWCSGAAEDRLKAGYCNRCYLEWTRRGRPDRVAYENEVEGRLTPSERAGHCTPSGP